jgi:DNA-binding HxlR family transcriptional regulator
MQDVFSDGETMKDDETPHNTAATIGFERSCCPITNALDIFGDRWTLLIIRDLILGKRRYQELISSAEKIASNILADRLKKLEVADLISRRAYQKNPERYEYFLTKKGESLKPVLAAIASWGQEHYPGTVVFPRIEEFDQS